jgi:hypothetical protein
VKRLRIYADTSVFGGCFDAEFDNVSRQFFREAQTGRFVVVISDVTTRELQAAPMEVRQVLAQLPEGQVEELMVDDEVTSLRDAYLAAGVVGAASEADAEHIAAATIAEVDIVVREEEAHRRQREAALADPILGPFLTRLRSQRPTRPEKPAVR